MLFKEHPVTPNFNVAHQGTHFLKLGLWAIFQPMFAPANLYHFVNIEIGGEGAGPRYNLRMGVFFENTGSLESSYDVACV